MKTYKLEPLVKLKHLFAVDVREGIFVDKNELTLNNVPITRFEASMGSLNDIIDFQVNQKLYQLRYKYNPWTGQPRSFIVIQNQRIIAQYGDDSAIDATRNT